MYDPFSQIVEPTIQTPTTITPTNTSTKLIFGLDEKIVIGIIMGMLILNFLQYMGE